MNPATDEPVRIEPYDPSWPVRFDDEQQLIAGSISKWIDGGIEHVGSTAVPGLAAKPIIDIMAGVESLSASRAAIPALLECGYRYYPYRVSSMHWFCKPSPEHRTHHLHLVPFRSRLWFERLVFRNYLRTHASAAAEYAVLKERLAMEHRFDREAYTDAKEPFIAGVLQRALQEQPGLFEDAIPGEDIPKLVEPAEDLRSEYLAMLDELGSAREHFRVEFARKDFQGFLQSLRAQALGIGQPPGTVPMTTFWLVSRRGTLLGESRLRHYLTPSLEDYGGHIGYVIRPSHRRRGWGYIILSLTLVKSLEFGLRRIRVTCDTENEGSARIIERNGGALSGYGVSPVNGKLTSQYWIEL